MATPQRPWLCLADDTCTASHGHDTYLGYRYGCRSKAARAAEARYRRGHDRVTIPALGTIRRLQALSAIGWADADLGNRLGVVKQAVQQWRTGRSRTVRLATAARIDELYVELSDHDGPCSYTRREAVKKRYLPPVWWDDDTIDDPNTHPGAHAPSSVVDDPRTIVEGLRHGRLTWSALCRPDRDVTIAHLHGQGRTRTDIAAVIGVDELTAGRAVDAHTTRLRRATQVTATTATTPCSDRGEAA